MSWMSGKPMSQLCSYLPGLCQNFTRERSQLVAILLMTSKWKHLRAQSQELDPIFIIPPQHLHNVLCVSYTKRLHIALSSLDRGRLRFVGAVLGRMFWLSWIFQRVSMFDDRRNSTSSGAEDWRIREPQVSVKTRLRRLAKSTIQVIESPGLTYPNRPFHGRGR